MSLLLLLACAEPLVGARAWQMQALDEGIGGPKAMARPGDFLLENEHLKVAVLGPRYSLGPSPYGGTLADIDLVRDDPEWRAGHGNDQMAEMFATASMNVAAADEPAEVQILQEGGPDEAAIVRTEAVGVGLLGLLELLWSAVDQPEMRLTTDYILEPGAEVLQIRTQVTILADDGTLPEGTGVEPELLAGTDDGLDVLGLAIEDGVVLGDFYLQGGSIDVFAPGIGFDEDGAVHDAAVAGRNLFQDPFRVPFLGGVGEDVSYGIAARSGSLYIPLFTSSQTAAFGAGVAGDPTSTEFKRFPPGTAFVYERYLAVGEGDMGSVYDRLAAARGETTGEVRGFVVEDGTGIPLSGVSVLAYEPGAEQPWMQWETDVGFDTQADGSFGGRLPPGDWELQVHARGRPDGPRVPITVSADRRVELVLGSPRPGEVRVRLVDEDGRSIPGKVTFRGEGPSPLDPDAGDPYIAGGAAEVVFAPHGEAVVVLPPGTYEVIGTRGLEYEMDQATVEVPRDGAAEVTLTLRRSVDSTGWVSADFHVHAANSFDSGVKVPDRVITMVSEGVEFFTSSDHDYITDYAPAVEALELTPWVKTGVGIETTTLEIGHFIGFPLADDSLAEQGGAFDWTGMTPDEILGTLEELGIAAGADPVRLVAHPRDGILGYFDQYGFNSYTAEVQTPITNLPNPLLGAGKFSLGFEALELLNGKRFELIRTPTQPELDAYAAGEALSAYTINERTAREQADLEAGVYRLGYGHEGQVDDWFTLLNTGVRLTALGNSDTHGQFSIEAGCPRNYVQSDTDDPARLDPQAIADAVREGRVVASYGPFVRFWANHPDQGVGAEVVDTDGTVDLHVTVEAPTWMAVDRVELYQNGALIHEWTALDPGPVRLDVDHPVTVDRDSWFVVIAMGAGSLDPVFTPVEIPPIQLQDVVMEALQDVEALDTFLSPAIPIPRTFDVTPYALTNPIWVDVDGAGWTPPGIPSWLQEPVPPGE